MGYIVDIGFHNCEIIESVYNGLGYQLAFDMDNARTALNMGL